MPRRLVTIPARGVKLGLERVLSFVGNRTTPIVAALLFVCLLLLLVAVGGWTAARDAQQSIDTDRSARDQSTIALCFTRSRTGPKVAAIFGKLVSDIDDSLVRKDAIALVDTYRRETPRRSACILQARQLGVEWEAIEQRIIANEKADAR